MKILLNFGMEEDANLPRIIQGDIPCPRHSQGSRGGASLALAVGAVAHLPQSGLQSL